MAFQVRRIDGPRAALVGAIALSIWMGVGCESGDNTPEQPDFGNPIHLDPLDVTGFSPTGGLSGDSVFVTGRGFSSSPEGNILTIGGARLPVVHATDSTLTAVIPAHSAGGALRVSDVSGWRSGTATGTFELRAPASIVVGYNGDPGQPVISSDLADATVVDSTTTALSISGLVSAESGSGYWAIVDDQHFVRSSGLLTVQDGTYSQIVPLFCGQQRLLVFFTNGEGRAFYRTDLDRQNCTEAAIRVQLSWDSDGTDVDTHLVQPGGQYGSENDCYYANCQGSTSIDWGAPGEADDPVLDVDDVDGFGPENIFVNPSVEGEYTVIIHYFSDHGQGPSNAWVEVYIHGARAGSFGPETLEQTGERWTVCRIAWPSGTVVDAR